MLCQFICLGEIPDRSLRLVVTSASQDSASSVLVEKFIGPLPNVADHVHHSERACGFWMSGDGIRTSHRSALVRSGDRGSIPLIPPRIKPAIGALGSILPLPFARQPLSSPGRIRARILQGNPGDRLVCPTLGVCSILPVAQKIQVICRTIMRCIQELLKVSITCQSRMASHEQCAHGTGEESPPRDTARQHRCRRILRSRYRAL